MTKLRSKKTEEIPSIRPEQGTPALVIEILRKKPLLRKLRKRLRGLDLSILDQISLQLKTFQVGTLPKPDHPGPPELLQAVGRVDQINTYLNNISKFEIDLVFLQREVARLFVPAREYLFTFPEIRGLKPEKVRDSTIGPIIREFSDAYDRISDVRGVVEKVGWQLRNTHGHIRTQFDLIEAVIHFRPNAMVNRINEQENSERRRDGRARKRHRKDRKRG